MREFIRHPIDIPIEYQLASLKTGRRERLKNISRGGLCFRAERALRRGSQVRITIPVREPAFETTGTIVWCRRDENHYDVGVQFADANTEFSVRMVEQICQIQHYQKRVLEEEGRQLSSAEAAAEWVGKYAQDFPR
ncbi:MAG TPA: PilZ domain-containing protein [Candidatus Competibacter sp.]|nr:pilus assembly protein PilZ [Candidatus Competibacteraceae bacterium]HRE53924.1 PilZ domain-containing protein [Candidatus Competibacter sp.]HUM94724.1 PilZ domain-containing protein [Candidatus Competibacter sp.]